MQCNLNEWMDRKLKKKRSTKTRELVELFVVWRQCSYAESRPHTIYDNFSKGRISGTATASVRHDTSLYPHRLLAIVEREVKNARTAPA